MRGRFKLETNTLHKLRYFLCFAAGFLFAVGVLLRNRANSCSDVCNQVIRRTEEGKYLLGPQYRIFKLADGFQIRATAHPNPLEDIFTEATIFCRYHAVQVAFFTQEKRPKKLYGKYPISGTIMVSIVHQTLCNEDLRSLSVLDHRCLRRFGQDWWLQMRHDALVGLPGGGVRVNETLMQGLQRELREEIGLDHPLTTLNYQLSYSNPRMEYCGHLYTKEMSWMELQDLMLIATASSDIGVENQGYYFLPTINEVDDDPGYAGFPTFLAQAISPASPPTLVGNTLQQLLHVLIEVTQPPILSQDHFQTSLDKACELLRLSVCPSSAENIPTGATLSNFYQ
ncbi:hypothetical protein T265_00142 [Opisthorchis viverrini]|uniref:Uncharacterized protein n=1 Tax=Opisthorchis viverrini TaxID=6198 RepID=A0A075A3P7_OPIVI|nr:hypothetical protein T265_00142 [Opisthorchis viverrini]KER34298.1 hypothetical protein T265_00142 [Opisthorchis viverrini]